MDLGGTFLCIFVANWILVHLPCRLHHLIGVFTQSRLCFHILQDVNQFILVFAGRICWNRSVNMMSSNRILAFLYIFLSAVMLYSKGLSAKKNIFCFWEPLELSPSYTYSTLEWESYLSDMCNLIIYKCSFIKSLLFKSIDNFLETE